MPFTPYNPSAAPAQPSPQAAATPPQPTSGFSAYDPNAPAPAASTLPQNQPAPEQTPGVLGKVASFLGLDKLGIGAGRAIDNVTGAPDQLLQQQQQQRDLSMKLLAQFHDPNTTPEIKAHITNFLQNTKLPDQTSQNIQDVGTAGLTNQEVLGSAAQTGANIALAGLPGAPEGSGLATRLGVQAAQGAGAGAVLGTAQGITDNKSLGESLKEGLVTGTVGGILGGGAQGVSEIARGLTAPALVQKLYDSAIGVSKKVAQSGRSPSTELIKNGVVGTAQQIYNGAQDTIDRVDPKISTILNNSGQTISLEGVMATLAHGVNTSVGNEGKSIITSTEMRQVLQDSLPQVRTLLNKDEITMPELNKLRQIMDRTLGDRAFTGATLPFKKDALYDASNALRELVKKVEPDTRPLFKEYSTAVQTIKALNSELAKPHVLRHMLSLLSAAGGGLPGLAAGLVNEGAQTTIAKTATAVGLSKVNQALQASDKSLAVQLTKKFGHILTQNAAKKITATGSRLTAPTQ